MKRSGQLLARSVSASSAVIRNGLNRAPHRIALLVSALCAIAIITTIAAAPLHAQIMRSLSDPPAIFIVGANDASCQESADSLQRLIREFAFVRGHSIYLVCDHDSWKRSLHHLTLEYGVVVFSRAAVSDLHLRETWFYAPALRKGAEHRTGEQIYAHELGHFVCNCIDEPTADKAAQQLLDDARRNRFNNALATNTVGASK